MGDPKRGLPPSVTEVQGANADELKPVESKKDEDHEVVEEMRKEAEVQGKVYSDKLLNSEAAKQAEIIIGKERVLKIILNIVERDVENSFVNALEGNSVFLRQRSVYQGGEGSPFIFETLVEAKAKLAALLAWEEAWRYGANIGRDCRNIKEVRKREAVEEGRMSELAAAFGRGDELEAETWQKGWQKKMGEAYDLLLEV